MGVSTPEQFAKKLGRMSQQVSQGQARALRARARVTKEYLYTEAVSQAPLQARPSWVKLTVDEKTATLRLHGGFAKLIELGSYHQHDGYAEEAKRVTARRRANALKKGILINTSGLMYTPYGPRPYVHHPFVRPRPFWQSGLAKSRKPGREAYQQAVYATIDAALK